jgi:hypothetical protein
MSVKCRMFLKNYEYYVCRMSNVSEERLSVEYFSRMVMCRMFLNIGYVSNVSEERLCVECSRITVMC